MIRLFVSTDLVAGGVAAISREQTHYLTNVMRLTPHGELLVFNGRDGEWLARLGVVTKHGSGLELLEQQRPHSLGPDLDLIIALVKRARLETIIEKAAELGARRVRLVTTERTNADHTNVTRLTAIATEAAEQTGRLDVPQILAPETLKSVLRGWDPARQLMFCDEADDTAPILPALQRSAPSPWAILIGPEGGFSPQEREQIRKCEGVTPVSLGPRILRADTAAISALSLWQAALGDWRGA